MKFYKTEKQAADIAASLAKQLIEMQKTMRVEGGKSQHISLPVGYDLYEIKTISAKSDTQEGMTVSIYADSEFQEEIYRSLTQAVIEDIVAIPVRDKSGGKSLFVAVNNPAAGDMNAEIKIKAVNL